MQPPFGIVLVVRASRCRAATLVASQTQAPGKVVDSTSFLMTTAAERQKALQDILEQRVLILDGAMGTMLQQRHLTAADFGGSALEGCNEVLLRTRPDVVLDIHRAYFTAGSDMVETNSFNGARVSLA